MRATQQEYEKIKEAFEILSGEMDDRDEDCAIPKNAVDKGYSLAVEHMKREMEEHDQSLSPEEREKERKKSLQEARAIMENAEQKKREHYQIVNAAKYQRFVYLSEQAMQFSKISGCNIKVQTFPDMSALIKLQTGCIWLLSDGETALEDKETMQCLLNEADWVYIGNSDRDGKNMLELEFRFELAEKLKKATI